MSQLDRIDTNDGSMSRKDTIEPASMLVGTTLTGNGVTYEIKKKIGRGAYAVVYRVTSLQDNKDYVIKKINLEFIEDQEVKMVYQEQEKLYKLKSQYIINIHSYFLQQFIMYIVMDYADGGDLFNLIL